MSISDIDISRYKVILLDRDGVINRLRANDYVKTVDEFEFLPNVVETIAKWSKNVRYIFVVTNQRGVGKNIMTESDLQQIHNYMLSEIEKAGGRIEKVYYCTALTCDDIRRKPGRGMFDDIIRDYPDIQCSECVMIGDSESDMEFAKNCGISSILV